MIIAFSAPGPSAFKFFVSYDIICERCQYVDYIEHRVSPGDFVSPPTLPMGWHVLDGRPMCGDCFQEVYEKAGAGGTGGQVRASIGGNANPASPTSPGVSS